MFSRRRFLGLLGLGAAVAPVSAFAAFTKPDVQPLRPGMVMIQVRTHVKGREAYATMLVNEDLWHSHPEVALKLAAEKLPHAFSLLK